MLRRLVDRFLMALVFLVLRTFFRSVEVSGRERIPSKRPVLVVANHFNGAVDAVMLVHVFGRVPRFLAKSTLWNVRLARPLYALAGMVPVHRPEDRPADGDNVSAFEAAHRVLAKRGVVAIFPEGTTHDLPALARIRTGAARIAFGAREAGIDGLVIVPVGLAFDDKLALRTRALARVGEPIDLDADLHHYVDGREAAGEDHVDAVRRLTAEIEARLREVFLSLIQNAPFVTYIKDIEGRYLFYNRESERVFHLGTKRYFGKTIRDIYDPTYAAAIVEMDRKVVATGEPILQEVRMPPDVEYEWALLVKFPIRDQAGKVVAIGGFDIDGNVAPQRMVADPEATRAAYRTGRMAAGSGGLKTTPIIDYRTYYDDLPEGDVHLRFHSFSTRARLEKANGYSDNMVMLLQDRRYGDFDTTSPVLVQALAQMDQWLTDATRDGSPVSIEKLRRGGEAHEAGGVVAFLASPAASFVRSLGADPQALVRNGKLAARAARASPERVALYDPAHGESEEQKMRYAARLRRALEDGMLRLVFGPQLDLQSGRIAGLEGLLRWHDAELEPPRSRLSEALGSEREAGKRIAYNIHIACTLRRQLDCASRADDEPGLEA